MFYEAIYTRCRKGIDIMTGAERINDGNKVYSCSNELLGEGFVDKKYFSKEIAKSQSFREPDFMDDAYLYYTPMVGNNFIINFHPFKFDPTIEARFANRGGIINQGIVGDFSDIYPFELFRDKNVWYAQERGQAFYYTTDPTPLPARDDIKSPSGVYSIDDIKAFVQDGRREALKSAIAFIIKAFSDGNASNQCLLISDESTTNIELWIAAIEYGFSPRLAANISFATRMDQFVNNNRIKQGETAPCSVNCISDELKSKFRAMIIGVVSSDRQNTPLIRSAQNYGFALLDGIQKKAMFDADTSNKYFDFVTMYDDAHTAFCREFLQTFGLGSPSQELFKLLQYYLMLSDDTISVSNYIKVIRNITHLSIHQTRTLKGLYSQANNMLDVCLKEDFSGAMSVMDWISKAATVLKDEAVTSRLYNTVCDSFDKVLYDEEAYEETQNLWKMVRASGFLKAVSERVTDANNIAAHKSDIAMASPNKAIQIAEIYAETSKINSNADTNTAKQMAAYCAVSCSNSKDEKAIHRLIEVFSNRFGPEKYDFWLDVVKSCETGTAVFTLENLLASMSNTLSSEHELELFCELLSKKGFHSVIPMAIKQSFSSMGTCRDVERFFTNKKLLSFIKPEDMSKVLKYADDRIGVDSSALRVAQYIQENRPERVAYSNSAHILGLDAISNKRKKEELTDILPVYIKQRFPSVTNERYINDLVVAITRAKLSEKELVYILKCIVPQTDTYFKAFLIETNMSISKNSDLWSLAISVASKTKDEDVRKKAIAVITDTLVECNQSAKAINKLDDFVDDDAYSFYKVAAQKALKILDTQPKKGLFGMFKK